MATIYLDLDSGIDTNDGLTLGAPKLTLGSAMPAAGVDGTVILLDGTYILSANLQTIMSTDGITFQSQSLNPELCIIDGTVANLYEWSMKEVLNKSFDVIGIEFINMHITSYTGIIAGSESNGTTGETRATDCIFEKITLQNGQTNWVIGVYYGDMRNTISGCRFINCGNAGTYVYGARVQFGTGNGWFAVDKCTFFNDSSHSEFSGMIAPTGAAVLTVTNTILYMDGSASPYAVYGAGGVTTVTNCCHHNAGAGSYQLNSVETEANNITTDPQFLDVTAGNLRLKPTSPCIDTGTLV